MATVPHPPLPPFPAAAGEGLAMPEPLAGRGLRLRPLEAADLPWLRDLYASTRADEMAGLDWPQVLQRSFLDDQFAHQHRHYVVHFADAEFLAIESADGALGRLILRRREPEHLLVDISLFPAARGGGLGTALVRAAQEDAACAGRDLCLHVQAGNAGARRLYRRLGFLAEGEAGGSHQRMRWRMTLS